VWVGSYRGPSLKTQGRAWQSRTPNCGAASLDVGPSDSIRVFSSQMAGRDGCGQEIVRKVRFEVVWYDFKAADPTVTLSSLQSKLMPVEMRQKVKDDFNQLQISRTRKTRRRQPKGCLQPRGHFLVLLQVLLPLLLHSLLPLQLLLSRPICCEPLGDQCWTLCDGARAGAGGHNTRC
jgi:hypothetical protein